MKKVFSAWIALCLLFFCPLYANIDEQIRAIQNAPVGKRFELMNVFKKKLIRMKESERIEALKKLTLHSKKQDASKVLEALKKYTAQQKARKQLEIQHIDLDNIQNGNQNEGDDDD